MQEWYSTVRLGHKALVRVQKEATYAAVNRKLRQQILINAYYFPYKQLLLDPDHKSIMHVRLDTSGILQAHVSDSSWTSRWFG